MALGKNVPFCGRTLRGPQQGAGSPPVSVRISGFPTVVVLARLAVAVRAQAGLRLVCPQSSGIALPRSENPPPRCCGAPDDDRPSADGLRTSMRTIPDCPRRPTIMIYCPGAGASPLPLAAGGDAADGTADEAADGEPPELAAPDGPGGSYG